VDFTHARDFAAALDVADPIGHLRERYSLPEGVVYLDGNSLGALAVEVPAAVDDIVERQWGRDLITSWNEHDWWSAPRRIGAQVARLIGARDDEVVVADSTSVNLFKVLVTAARLRPGRRVLLIEPGNFPADLYIADSVGDLLGLEVHLDQVHLVINANPTGGLLGQLLCSLAGGLNGPLDTIIGLLNQILAALGGL